MGLSLAALFLSNLLSFLGGLRRLAASMLIISLSIYTAPHSSAAQDESLRELEQLIRAGEDGKALERIEGISGNILNLERFGVSLTADFLIGREKWELATRFLEVYPQARPGWGIHSCSSQSQRGEWRSEKVG